MKEINIKGAVLDNMSGDMYDYLGIENTHPKMVSDVLNSADNAEDIVVNIASPGGNVDAASEIYTQLKQYAGKVIVNIQGLAASAASFIAMAGDEVNISPTAQIMIHKASTFSGGNSEDMTSTANMLSQIDKSIANAYQLKTGKSQADLLQMMANETWLTAQDAIDGGFADTILFVDEKAPLVTNGFDYGPTPEAVNKFMTIMTNNKQANSQPTDDLKSRKLAILLGK